MPAQCHRVCRWIQQAWELFGLHAWPAYEGGRLQQGMTRVSTCDGFCWCSRAAAAPASDMILAVAAIGFGTSMECCRCEWVHRVGRVLRWP